MLLFCLGGKVRGCGCPPEPPSTGSPVGDAVGAIRVGNSPSSSSSSMGESEGLCGEDGPRDGARGVSKLEEEGDGGEASSSRHGGVVGDVTRWANLVVSISRWSSSDVCVVTAVKKKKNNGKAHVRQCPGMILGNSLLLAYPVDAAASSFVPTTTQKPIPTPAPRPSVQQWPLSFSKNTLKRYTAFHCEPFSIRGWVLGLLFVFCELDGLFLSRD